MTDGAAKQCPWCGRWALKASGCNYIFACGLDAEAGFVPGTGCGRPWCWSCGKRFCGRYLDAETGARLPGGREFHDARCCAQEEGFRPELFCPGGHNSHCLPRF